MKCFCAHHEGLGFGGVAPLILRLRILGSNCHMHAPIGLEERLSLLRPLRIEPRFVSCPARILVTLPTTLSRPADNYYYVLKPKSEAGN